MAVTDGIGTLQQRLPTWVRLERRAGDPEVKAHTAGNVEVVEVNTFPETPPSAVRADVHFVTVAPTEGFPEAGELVKAVRGALGQGEFSAMSAEDLTRGPSYIALGGWLGSQDLALMLIGAVELAGIAKAITPEKLGATGAKADEMAGMGLVMLGPSTCWSKDASS